MKSRILSFIALFTCIAVGTTHATDKIELLEQQPTISTEEYLYEIQENEVLVNDKLITLFALSKGGISATYRNKTDEEKKPRYTIEVYNPYGLLVGKKTLGDSIAIFGNNTYMEPGEVSAEKVHLDLYPLSEILKNSNLKLPDNLMEMKWIVLSDTNTKDEPKKTG